MSPTAQTVQYSPLIPDALLLLQLIGPLIPSLTPPSTPPVILVTIAENIQSPDIQAENWCGFGKTFGKLHRIPDALNAYHNARQLYQQMQLPDKIQECDTAIQQLQTPTPLHLTIWQKLRQLYRRFVSFIRHLYH